MSTKVIQEANWLNVEFDQPHKVLSWAIVNGGVQQTSQIVWYKVEDKEMSVDINPRMFFLEKLKSKGWGQAVGLLTSAELETFIDTQKDFCQNSARCIATVGLTNALRVGDLPAKVEPVGTINLMVQLSAALTDEAYVEAISIATEARTAAILDEGYSSFLSEQPATGTGTDCIVIAAPVADLEDQKQYVGKHTDLGHLIGSVVYDSISQGVKQWKKDN